MEGDRKYGDIVFFRGNFNPLPPHGGRPKADSAAKQSQEFQSTPSAWRETRAERNAAYCQEISIHSLRMEGDRSQMCDII